MSVVDADETSVTGTFRDRRAAHEAVNSMIGLGVQRESIRTTGSDETRRGAPGLAERGFLGGAAVGGLVGSLLEATVLAFPPASVFLFGGTLVATVAGLTVGAGTGAAAGALVRSGHEQRPAARVHRSGTGGPVVVSVTSLEDDVRARARHAMRVHGAIETRDIADDRPPGDPAIQRFGDVAAQLRAHLGDVEGTDRRWAEIEPSYLYGWQMANRPDFSGTPWAEAADEVRRDWQHRHPDIDWSAAEPFIARGYQAVEGRVGRRKARPSGEECEQEREMRRAGPRGAPTRAQGLSEPHAKDHRKKVD